MGRMKELYIQQLEEDEHLQMLELTELVEPDSLQYCHGGK